MPRFAAGERVGEHAARIVLHSGRKLVHRLTLVLELEAEVCHATLEGERCVLMPAVEHQRCRARCGELPDEPQRDRRPFDGRARITVRVGEVAKDSTDGSPAPGDAGLRHACLAAVRRLLIDHEIKRLDAREQLDEPPLGDAAHHRHRRRKREPDRTIHTRHGERRVLDGLHEDAAPCCPSFNALVEEMTREAVDLANVSAFVKRLGVHVVGSQVVTSAHDETGEIAIFTRHAMERLDAGHD